MEALQDWVVSLASSPWVYLLVVALCLVDGFFPPIPSEALVMGLAATWASIGEPSVWLLFPAAVLGAFSGDQVAYTIGRRTDVRRRRPFQGPMGVAALDRAERLLDGRGASLIVAARFVPIGRVAVNMTAGTVRFPRFRYSFTVALAASLWAAYGVLIGAFSGRLADGNALVAVAASIVVGVAVGLVVDPVVRRWYAARGRGRDDGA